MKALLLGWRLILPPGKCLESLRRPPEEGVWVVEEQRPRLKDELYDKKKGKSNMNDMTEKFQNPYAFNKHDVAALFS